MNSDEVGISNGLSPPEFYHAVYDDLPHGIVVLKNERIFYANEAYSQIVGYSIETIMKWTKDELFKPLLSKQKELMRLYEEKGKNELNGSNEVYTIQTGEEKIRYIEMIPIRFSLKDGEYYHAMIVDVTDRIMAARNLRESEERFRNTFDSIPDQAYLWEKKDHGDITLRMANKRSLEVSAGFVNKHLGKEPNELFIDNPEFSEYIQFSMKTGQKIKTETTFSYPNQPDVTTVIIECVKPTENLVLMIITDITEERRVQEIAKRSEKEKSIILDSMRDHLVYYETDSLQISWANKAAADSVNLTPAELMGKYCYEIWQGRSEPCSGCPVLVAWNTGEPHECETRSPEGRMWLVKGLPVKNLADKVTAVVEVTREITAEKETERLTKDAKHRAELYLDLLGHDLNNIHQGVIIGLELALQSENLSNNLANVLQASLDQVNRGVTLISNVQKFSLILDSPTLLIQKKILSVIELAIKMVRSSFPLRELRINLDIPDEEITVKADEFLVDAIFNLFHNTMKHDSNEVVMIDVKITKPINSDFIVFRIDDRGPGVDDESKKVLLNRLES